METRPYKLLYPMRVHLISASHEGKDNFMPATWVFPLSFNPTVLGVAISEKRYTHGLIKKSGYFVINIPGSDMKEKIEKHGRSSGRETDKFALWDVTRERCVDIPAVSIKETLVSMECKVINTYEAGDHTIFMGQLVHLRNRKEGKGIYQTQEGYVSL